MNSPSSRIAILSLLLGTLLLGGISATAQNEIVPNPKGAVKLRRIWYKLGPAILGQEVGTGAGPVGDINADGYSDIAVRVALQWQVYLGGDPAPTTEPAWVFDSATWPNVRFPVVGDFFGNGDTLVGFMRFRPERPTNPTRGFAQIFFYRRNQSTVLEGPVLIWDAEMTMDPPVRTYPNALFASDLDRDGADELVIVLPVLGRTEETDTQTEIWIFRGGPEFSLVEPTHIIKDAEANDDGDVSVSVTDVDGDGTSDMILGENYRSIPKLKFWWGEEGSPWNWTDQPHRIVELPSGTITPQFLSAQFLQDIDGDRAVDILGEVYLGDSAGTYLWRSGAGKNIRERLLNGTDYDDFFPDLAWTRGFGYVADSNRHYEMIALESNISFDPAYGLAGGPDGPNHTYDAYFGGGDGPSSGGVSAGDVDGDGWQDRIIASETYGGPGVGAAAIIAGGPYIPNDDPSLSVRQEPVAGESGGLFLWPNPVADELHIAWKGNLKQMPARLTVHDVAGRLIVQGPVDSWRGEALWRCTDVPAGTYLLSVFDTNGEILATTTVIKQ